jgi:PPOX class probable F420-dependent enzyme
MSDQIDDRAKEIVKGPNYAHVSIPRRDGSVQSVIAWADEENGKLTLNSAEGRAWPANLRRSGRATVTMLADGNPYEWVSVEGRLEQASTEGADEHIDALAKKYLGVDTYPYRTPDEQRIKLTLQPEKVHYVKQG